MIECLLNVLRCVDNCVNICNSQSPFRATKLVIFIHKNVDRRSRVANARTLKNNSIHKMLNEVKTEIETFA